MADIINLRQARKDRVRAEKEKTAETNRVLHGTPKAVRDLAKARKDKLETRLEEHKLEDGDK
ncbi:MAG: hypothetical protein BGN85_01435 [Alphaproteobacteria bacterium 64-11]|nr:DUF4169 family protein [Alphaproteobacteria bacterium]OJU12237.1 MAG: hypothetical protein BGN85_01435 [Alphaproteobacteria bacterium 64-11]